MLSFCSIFKLRLVNTLKKVSGVIINLPGNYCWNALIENCCSETAEFLAHYIINVTSSWDQQGFHRADIEWPKQ